MSMKRLIFKGILAMLLSATALPVYSAEVESEDTMKMSVMETPETMRYHERLMKRQQRWDRLIPNLFILQYAGDIGMFSAGIGWDYGSSNQWETHLALGYLPSHQKYHYYWTFTLREVYLPWNVKIRNNWQFKPLAVSLAVNSMLSGEFWTSEPDRYPSGYYGFSSKLRFQLGLGQRISWSIPEHHRFLSQKIAFYYEIVTCDLYVRQKILNKKIPFKDIFALGLGFVYTI